MYVEANSLTVRTRQAARKAREEADKIERMESKAQELAKENLDLATKLQTQEPDEEEDDLESPIKLQARELVEDHPALVNNLQLVDLAKKDPESVMKLQERHDKRFKAPVEVEDHLQHNKSPRDLAEEMANIVNMLREIGTYLTPPDLEISK